MSSRRYRILIAAVCGVLLGVAAAQAAPGRYLETSEFLADVFGDVAPVAESITVDAKLRAGVEEILRHRFARLRVRYWGHDHTTAWIFDEVGKTEPITIGVSIVDGRVAAVRVLEFRESRGWEVRYPFFTDQFNGSVLTGSREIDRDIDGITGATLSVTAVSKVVRLALFLDERARDVRTRADSSASS